jgi:hypothetical protein
MSLDLGFSKILNLIATLRTVSVALTVALYSRGGTMSTNLSPVFAGSIHLMST